MASSATRLTDPRPLPPRERVIQLARITGDHLPLVQKRLEALDAYLETPLPDRVKHLWRYSDPLVLLPQHPFVVPQPGPELGTINRTPGIDDVFLVPGMRPVIVSSDSGADEGMTITPLNESDEGIERLGRAVPAQHGLFEALNASIWSCGVMINVAKNRSPSRVLRITHLASLPTTGTRVVINLEPGAALKVIEVHDSGGAGISVLSVSEQFVGRNAELSHLLIQTWDKGTAGHVTSRAVVEADGRLNASLISLGGAHYKADVGAVLDGVNAISHITGMGLCHGRQAMDHHTFHDHRHPHTESELEFKVALTGRAKSAYTGLIRIGETAEKSEAYQECRNLLLSSRAQTETIPELEILTNDVRCSHGATSGPLDPEQLFYLKSRGISQAEAIALMVRGFFENAIIRVPRQLRPNVESTIDHHLSRGGLK